MAPKPSAPPRRPRQQNDAAPQEAVRAHWREVVRRLQPVDDTARLDLDVDSTAPRDLDTVAVKRSAPPVHRTSPVGDTARLPRRRPIRPPAPPRWPRQQNDAPLHEAVTVGEANLWGLRVKRTAVAFGAVLLFLALVVLSGRPFGGDDHPAPQPSVPSASGDGSAGTEQPAPDRGSPGAHPEGSSGGALPPAQGVQAFSGDTEPQAQPMPPEPEQNRPSSWRQPFLNVVLVVLSLGLFTVSSTTLWWMLHAVAQSGRVGGDWFSASSSRRTSVVLIAVTGSPRTGCPRGHDRRAGSARPPQVRGDRDHRS